MGTGGSSREEVDPEREEVGRTICNSTAGPLARGGKGKEAMEEAEGWVQTMPQGGLRWRAT